MFCKSFLRNEKASTKEEDRIRRTIIIRSILRFGWCEGMRRRIISSDFARELNIRSVRIDSQREKW